MSKRVGGGLTVIYQKTEFRVKQAGIASCPRFFMIRQESGGGGVDDGFERFESSWSTCGLGAGMRAAVVVDWANCREGSRPQWTPYPCPLRAVKLLPSDQNAPLHMQSAAPETSSTNSLVTYWSFSSLGTGPRLTWDSGD